MNRDHMMGWTAGLLHAHGLVEPVGPRAGAKVYPEPELIRSWDCCPSDLPHEEVEKATPIGGESAPKPAAPAAAFTIYSPLNPEADKLPWRDDTPSAEVRGWFQCSYYCSACYRYWDGEAWCLDAANRKSVSDPPINPYRCADQRALFWRPVIL